MKLIFFKLNFVKFKHKYYLLQSSPFRQLHADGDVVPTQRGCARNLQLLRSSKCLLKPLGWFPVLVNKTSADLEEINKSRIKKEKLKPKLGQKQMYNRFQI